MEIKVGDIVQKKSGGPEMKVTKISKKIAFTENQIVWAEWHDGNNLHTEELSASDLKLIRSH
jgi:uncharacterized protein YodC (DUF2158 family)